MATTIAGFVRLAILVSEFLTATNVAEGSIASRINEDWSFEDGTDSVLKADLVYVTRATIDASGTLSIDLSGSLKTTAGDDAVFAEVCAVYVRNRSTGAGGVVTVGPPGSAGIPNLFAALGDALRLVRGADFLFRDPSGTPAVTATSADLLNIVEVGGALAATVNVIVIGRSA